DFAQGEQAFHEDIGGDAKRATLTVVVLVHLLLLGHDAAAAIQYQYSEAPARCTSILPPRRSSGRTARMIAWSLINLWNPRLATVLAVAAEHPRVQYMLELTYFVRPNVTVTQRRPSSSHSDSATKQVSGRLMRRTWYVDRSKQTTKSSFECPVSVATVAGLNGDGKQLLPWSVNEIETLRTKRVGLQGTEVKAGGLHEIVDIASFQVNVKVVFEILNLEEEAESFDPDRLDLHKLSKDKGAAFAQGGVGPFRLIVMASDDL
ncbi:hypothetical protein E2562_013393, partial [Oryza meyeriana var. granulata]